MFIDAAVAVIVLNFIIVNALIAIITAVKIVTIVIVELMVS
jgi:hypothetical protein